MFHGLKLGILHNLAFFSLFNHPRRGGSTPTMPSIQRPAPDPFIDQLNIPVDPLLYGVPVWAIGPAGPVKPWDRTGRISLGPDLTET